MLGANGKVGQAVIQLATAAQARVFGVERAPGSYRGHATGEVTMLGASEGDIAERVMDATQGHGADIVFNTVGSPYFDAANRAMAIRGRQIFISTIERSVPFDILAFYRGRRRFIGVDTLQLTARTARRFWTRSSPASRAARCAPSRSWPPMSTRSPARPTPIGRCSPERPSASCSTPRCRIDHETSV